MAADSDREHDGRERDGRERDDAGRWGPKRDDGWRGEEEPEKQPERPHAPSLLRHSLESSLAVVLAVALAAYVLPASVPLWMPAGALVAVTAVTWYSAYQMTRSVQLSGYLLAWGLLISGWLVLARTAGLTGNVLFALAVMWLVLAPLGAVVTGRYRESAEAARRADRDRAGIVITQHWEGVLHAHGVPGIKVLDVQKHHGSLEIRGRLPRAAPGRATLTFEQLSAKSGEIAVSERRDDDGVYFSQPDNGTAADFLLHVRDKRAGKRKPVHLPVRHDPLTVNRPFGVGMFDSGKEYGVLLRERHVQIIGLTGAGKSNLVNVFLDRLAGCIDALIWMIDMKGGKTARPWVVPYLQGLTSRPVIDWLATTREEAEVMLETALLAMQIRAGYPGFEKIIPSRDVPQIVLFCDDVGRCFGHSLRENGVSNFGLSQLAGQFTEQARSSAGVLVGAGQRANVELWGGTGIKAMSDLRFGLRCSSATDGAQIFPDNAHAARMVSKLRDDGDALVMSGPDISPPVHLYRVGDEQRITNRALWAGDLRPVPEQRLVTGMGDAYAQRWDRQADLMDDWREAAGQAAPVQPAGDDEDSEAGAGTGSLDDQEDFDREFAGITGRWSAPDLDEVVDPRRKVMWRILRDAGYQGLPVRSIVTRLENQGARAERETVHRWLAKDEKKGWVRRGKRGGTAVWIWSQHGDAEYLLAEDAM